MAMRFSFLTRRRARGLTSREKLLQLSQKDQVQVPLKKPRLGWLQRLGLGLGSFEPATPLYKTRYEDRPFLPEYGKSIYSALRAAVTGEPTEEIRERKSIADILVKEGMRGRPGKLDPADVLGLVGDIATDPVTWLTFGIGGATKISAKGGVKIGLSKSGQKFLSESLETAGKEIGEQAVKKEVARYALEEAPELLARGGIKFMGKTIVPQTTLKKAGLEKIGEKGLLTGGISTALDVSEKIPGIKKIVTPIRETGRGLFKPFAEIEKLPAQIGEEYRYGIFGKFAKGTRTEIQEAVENVGIIGKKTRKEFGREAGEVITEALETGVKTGEKSLDDIASWIKKSHEEIWQEESKRGLITTKTRNYMRHILSSEAKDSFQRGTLSPEFFKPIRVRLGAAKPRQLTGTIKEINKEFYPQLGYNLFEPDAFKAFALRKTESIKAIRTFDFLSNVSEEFGVPAKYTTKEIRTVGGKIVKKKIAPPIYKEGIKYIEPQATLLKGTLLPESIAKHIDETSRILFNDESTKNFLGFYDKALNIWKSSVTGWFPAFHTRNFLGATFNNFLAGVTNPGRYLQARKIISGADGNLITRTGKKYSFDQVRKLIKEEGILGQPGRMDVMRTTAEMVSPTITQKITRPPRFAMEFVENRVRTPLFIDRLIKGDSPAEAVKKVFKFHFDYSPEALTAFERGVAKRLIPFYTWTRNNVPLQFEMLGKQPGKYAGFFKGKRAIEKEVPAEKLAEEEKILPDWMKEMFVTRLPGEKPRYLQLDLPMEDLAKIPVTQSGRRELISLITPLLKVPTELYANRNFYFGSDIYDKDVPPELRTAKTEKWFHDLASSLPGVAKFLNLKKTKTRDYEAEKRTKTKQKLFKEVYEMDASKLHAIRGLLASRIYSTLKGATAPDLGITEKISRYLGGVPIRTLDIEREKGRKESQEEREAREILNYLKRHNIIPYETGSRRRKSRRFNFLQ